MCKDRRKQCAHLPCRWASPTGTRWGTQMWTPKPGTAASAGSWALPGCRGPAPPPFRCPWLLLAAASWLWLGGCSGGAAEGWRRWRLRGLGSLQGLAADVNGCSTAMQATESLLLALRCLAAGLLLRAEPRTRACRCGADVLSSTIRVTGCNARYPPQGLPRAQMGLHVAEMPCYGRHFSVC